MTPEEIYQIESSQRQHNEVMRREQERIDMGVAQACLIAKTMGCEIVKKDDFWHCIYESGIQGFGKTAAEAINNFAVEFGL